MHSSPTLHSLLRTLSQAEKRYLRIYIERHRKAEVSHSLAMLDLIFAQEPYDEATTKDQWSQLGFDSRQFASVKHYLFDLTLQAMRDFHRKGNARNIVEDLLTDAEFLYLRGLLGEASKHLNKARKIAVKFDYPALALQADALARTLALRAPADEALQIITDLETSSQKALALQALIAGIQQLHAQLTILARQRFRLRDAAGMEQLTALRESRILLQALEAEQFTPRFHALRCLIVVAHLEGDHEVIWERQQQLMAHFQTNAEMQREFSTLYLITLVNRLAFCQITNRFMELGDTLRLLESLELHSPIERIEVIHNAAYYRLLLAINLHEWAMVETAVESLRRVAEVHDHMIPEARKIAIRYNIAIAFFLLQESKHTLAALNTILNDVPSHQREDIQQAARYLHAVVHFELGNHDLLDYLLRNLKRHLQLKHALHAFEATLLRALKDLLSAPEKRQEILSDLQQKLLALNSDPANAHAPGLEEMQHWVESKLSGRSIREVLALASQKE